MQAIRPSQYLVHFALLGLLFLLACTGGKSSHPIIDPTEADFEKIIPRKQIAQYIQDTSYHAQYVAFLQDSGYLYFPDQLPADSTWRTQVSFDEEIVYSLSKVKRTISKKALIRVYKVSPLITGRHVYITDNHFIDNTYYYFAPWLSFFGNELHNEEPQREFINVPSYIRNCFFDKILFFEDNNFMNAKLNFLHCYFNGGLNVINAEGMGGLYTSAKGVDVRFSFTDCSFKDSVQLKGVTFSSDLTWNGCYFHKSVDLSNAKFIRGSSLTFSNCVLPGFIDMHNIQIDSGYIDLTNVHSNPGEKCKVFILGPSAKRINLSYNFCELYFPDSLLSKSEYRDLVSSTYENQLTKLNESGSSYSHEVLDIAYKDWKSTYKFEYFISRYWWQYGYSKYRILFITLAILILFITINYRNYSRVHAAYPIESLSPLHIPTNAGTLTRTWEKLLYTACFTASIFFRLTLEFQLLQLNKKPVFWIIFQYLMGLACTAFIINWIIGT